MAGYVHDGIVTSMKWLISRLQTRPGAVITSNIFTINWCLSTVHTTISLIVIRMTVIDSPSNKHNTTFIAVFGQISSSLISSHTYHHHLRLTSVVHACTGWTVSPFETPPPHLIQSPLSMQTQFNKSFFARLRSLPI